MATEVESTLAVAQSLGASLAVGLLIGLERGWRDRERAEGSRVAGLRTFALLGLLGGTAALLAPMLGPWPAAAALLAVAALFGVSYVHSVSASGSVSLTSAVAAVLTLALGALAASGHPVPAIAAAVVTALLLDLKSVLHGWLRRIEAQELRAALQLLVLSVVVLPLLPDRAMGPFGALNPYWLWWAVVLVAALSLSGRVAMRLTGPRRGLLWTGLLGGLASSTAATVALARHGRGRESLTGTLAAAIDAASAMMFLRMAVVVGVLQPAAAGTLSAGLALLAVVGFLVAAWQWRRAAGHRVKESLDHVSPGFDLSSALGFGLFLAFLTVAVHAAREAMGTAGLLGLAALSGLADVDAITISLMRMQREGSIGASAAGWALLAAAGTNLASKAAMAWAVGGAALGRRVALAFGVMVVAGAVLVLFVAR